MIRNKNKRGIVIVAICIILLIVCLILAYYNKDANYYDFINTKNICMIFALSFIGTGLVHPVLEILGWILLLLCLFLL